MWGAVAAKQCSADVLSDVMTPARTATCQRCDPKRHRATGQRLRWVVSIKALMAMTGPPKSFDELKLVPWVMVEPWVVLAGTAQWVDCSGGLASLSSGVLVLPSRGFGSRLIGQTCSAKA